MILLIYWIVFMMPQRKPVVVKSSRHVDGIKEMIDFVRNQQQQGCMTREVTQVDKSRLQKRAPLPGIGELEGADPLRPSGPYREGLIHSGDSDPAYESDEDLVPLDGVSILTPRTPSPPVRSQSVLSSKSTHNLVMNSSRRKRGSRSQSQDVDNVILRDPVIPRSKNLMGVRTLPPVQRVNPLDRCRTPMIPNLTLSDVDPEAEDFIGPADLARPSAPSPSTPSTRDDDDSLGEDGKPIDFIDHR